jgi:hypothetical protein
MAHTPEQLANARHEAEVEHARFARRADLVIKEELNEAWVLRQWRDIATADVNELMQFRRACCPTCYEGLPYDGNLPPVVHCPQCKGEGTGEEKVYFADTRTLSAGARRLFAGVKVTKGGMELKTRDQDAALLNIARYLKMLVDRQELTGANGGPLTMVGVSAAELTDDQLAALLVGGQQVAQLTEGESDEE